MRKPGEPARIVPPSHSAKNAIGIIAPASSFDKAELAKGCRVLQEAGHRTFYFDTILEKELYFAGSAKRRALELAAMFRRPEVDVIVCARGGYGSNHLLAHLNPRDVQAHPKMFIGYSDITTLLTYFCDQADIVTYHGPMVVSDYAKLPVRRRTAKFSFASNPVSLQVESGRGKQLRPGEAEGVLYGGCLSMLAASLGTPFEIDTENTLLFLEDVNTKPYQVDRMLMQLKYAGKFRGVRGFIFGEMPGCVQPGVRSYSVRDAIMSVLSDLRVPIGFGLPSGHVTGPRNYTLPIGAAARLIVGEKTMTLEPL